MDVYEFLREQRQLQNERLNVVADVKTPFMKRAVSRENANGYNHQNAGLKL